MNVVQLFAALALLTSSAFAAPCSPTFSSEADSGSINVPIPDGPDYDGTPGTPAIATVTVTDAFIIGSLTVTFSITHPFAGDLIVKLRAPDGTEVLLVSQKGQGSDFLAFTLDDSASDPVADVDSLPNGPFGGSWQPEEALSVLKGKQAAGTYQLVVVDTFLGDTGTIDQFTVDLKCLVCETACGDPHFKGLDGVKYEFQGTPKKMFALVSDPIMQLNSLFVPAPHHHTFMGEVCLRVCNDTITMAPPEFVSVNGNPMTIGEHYSARRVEVFRSHKHSVEVAVGNRWRFSFRVAQHIDIEHATALYAWDNKTHGVLGHTLKYRSQPKPNQHCNRPEQGGCEVEGVKEEYMVADLCSASWAHSMFDTEACF